MPALGQSLYLQGFRDPFRVVGVASDIDAPYDAALPLRIYLPAQDWSDVLVRTKASPEALSAPLAAALRRSGLTLSPTRVATGTELAEDLLRAPKFRLWIVAGCSVFAALLAVVGLFGVVSYAVRCRRRELAVRQVLGARPGQVLGLVIKAELRAALVGSAAGCLLAALAIRLADVLLEGSPVPHPAVLAASAALMACASLAACLLSSRRALRIEPASSLKAI